MSTERPLPERAIRPNALRIQPQRKAAPPTKRAQELLNSRNSQINSSPTTPRLSGLAARRAGNKLHLNDLDDITTRKLGGGVEGAGLGAGRPRRAPPTNAFQDFSNIVDPSGALRFSGKAILHAKGVNFNNGTSFSINREEFEMIDDLGRGNYGTVKKVLHTPTNVVMAMKEIRLELDKARLNSILTELDILHRGSASSPTIVEFFGAFFSDSCVYYCMEYMDAGSLDKLVSFPEGDTVKVTIPRTPIDEDGEDVEEILQWEGVPENVLARLSRDMVLGLKFLKDSLDVIHRDVKPTNVLVNTKGQVKLCDFGVSGQLEASMAKTNIGCQSYMAPERIKGESANDVGAYTVSADVWSLGLTVIEIGLGVYPYPPETYQNVFLQLSAIVDGDPPELPDRYSASAKDWVARCLVKATNKRATYAELMAHPWIADSSVEDVDMVKWVARSMAYRKAKDHADRQARDASAKAANTSHAPLSLKLDNLHLNNNLAVPEPMSEPVTAAPPPLELPSEEPRSV